MKKFIQTLLIGLTLSATGCTDLDVKVESQYTNSNFPDNAASYAAIIGPLYTQLSSKFAIEYWRMQELSTESSIIPARDGNYDDGGVFRNFHYHSWNADFTYTRDVWQWGFGGINSTNRLINLFEGTPESATKKAALAEVKTMRAYFYFLMMDLYGNLPLVDKFPVSEQPKTTSRDKIFQFIESELKSVVNDLPLKTNANAVQFYGRPTKGMAYAILTKLYLNAEYYIGKPMYNEAVAAADNILSSGAYSLDSDFNSLFSPNNGPSNKETIFAVPYDALLIPGNQFTRFGFTPFLYLKYELQFRPSIAMSTTPEYYKLFNLKGDKRTDNWVVGKQYNFDGSPVLYATTAKALDNNYTGTDKAINWQVEITPDLTLVPGKPMDVGNDILGQCKGIRSIKFYPDKNTLATTRMNGNDFPAFRLSDIILMKAEAILRGASQTTVAGVPSTPLDMVNMIRARVGAEAASKIDLDELLNERARELAWEGWRRNDLIRFNKYEVEYPLANDIFKMDKNPQRRIYPIPTTEMKLNPNLVQNPGY
ncbi:Starch-binding associating with outer membrane [Pseudarcicella hirudinis]|uniref:Starch-binding associating with outer membrane n=1 Tax=Pseudarcicella hirudinis TaxID=1079859 RepID=A0A1I5VFT5_9BACT|nr:RagB/SusD family nutrient uptake outer membrane protein [Pseudarcicella hirudinis]SFQ06335.1 Starch-binding associating with outer membrane [Pseudarcicella hirudinis]